MHSEMTHADDKSPMPMFDPPQYLTRPTVARLFGVSVRTVDRWTAAGELGYAHIGKRQIRFSLHHLAAFIAKKEVVAVA